METATFFPYPLKSKCIFN